MPPSADAKAFYKFQKNIDILEFNTNHMSDYSCFQNNMEHFNRMQRFKRKLDLQEMEKYFEVKQDCIKKEFSRKSFYLALKM